MRKASVKAVPSKSGKVKDKKVYLTTILSDLSNRENQKVKNTKAVAKPADALSYTHGFDVPSDNGKGKEKGSVTAMLADIDYKKNRKAFFTKAVAKPANAQPYINGFDLPPSDDEDDNEDSEELVLGEVQRRQRQRPELKLDVSLSDKELKKREKKQLFAALAIERAKQEALKDDREDDEKSEIWVVEHGTVTSFPGTFEEYKANLQREIKAEVDD